MNQCQNFNNETKTINILNNDNVSFRFIVKRESKTIEMIFMNKYNFGVIFKNIPHIIVPAFERASSGHEIQVSCHD